VTPPHTHTHLAFLPAGEGEVALAELLPPAAPGQRVEHDAVAVAAEVEARVEVHRDVVGVVADVDGEAAEEKGSG